VTVTTAAPYREAGDQALQVALGHHQAGRLAEAEALYRQVLDRAPDHPDALHFLGVLAGQAGRPDRAIALIGRAIAAQPANALYHSNLGEVYRRSGELDRALDHFRRALELQPDAAEPHNNLGNVLWQTGRPEEAAVLYRRAIALRPDYAEAHSNLGVVLTARGRLDEAVAALRRAIALAPGHAEAHSNLGDALKGQGRIEDALEAYRRAIALAPNLAQAHNNLGCALKDLGRLEEAAAAFHRAIRLAPADAAAHGNLGCALKDLGRLEEAAAAFHRVLALRPVDAAAHNNLGGVLKDLGRPDEAIASFLWAMALRPDLVDAPNNLGCALKDLGRLDEAIAAFHRAIALDPAYPAAHDNLGNALREQGRLDEAIAAFRRAIQLSPGDANAHNNLGIALKEQGRIEDALACFREAIAREPDLAKAASNYLYTLHLHPGYDARALLAEHRRWARRSAGPLAAEARPPANDRSPGRTLRVGYVSSDFRSHPVGRLLVPLFANHDRRRVTIVAYSDVRSPDALTAQLEALADEWRGCVGLGDRRLAERIRGDRIDILVDLALHTAGNRMRVFARKPAPVQVTMLGLPSTTGLDAIDHRLTDPHFDPPGSGDGDYSERSIRLPHTSWCYPPPEEAPPVTPLPALERGVLTFGCFNQLAKASPAALQLWARILRAVPGSRLVLQAPPGSHRDDVRALFEGAGIAPDRLAFEARAPFRDYLARYQDIDLGLDPFPYTGGITTMDALWMGVPVITLAGRTGVGRSGVSILSNVGLPELIAPTPEQYLARAVALAGDLDRLSELRGGLRRRMQASPLMDGRQYAADVEAAFRRAWETWCRA
jgi:predicted O-linked N-acetylglucosamine transferase (SPINDLY family)